MAADSAAAIARHEHCCTLGPFCSYIIPRAQCSSPFLTMLAVRTASVVPIAIKEVNLPRTGGGETSARYACHERRHGSEPRSYSMLYNQDNCKPADGTPRRRAQHSRVPVLIGNRH